MQFDLTKYTADQKRALLDLFVLVMYADGHLSVGEEAWLQEFMTQMGFQEETARQQGFDAAVMRIGPGIKDLSHARELALELASVFTARDQQKQIYEAIQWIMGRDGHVCTWENSLLTELRSQFQL
jgi:hypothetical protein